MQDAAFMFVVSDKEDKNILIVAGLIFLFILFYFQTSCFGEKLCDCDIINSTIESPDEVKIDEKGLSFEDALNSLEYLETYFIQTLQSAKDIESLYSDEKFYIGYPNHLSIIKGTVLKQNVMLAKLKLDIETLKSKTGKGSVKAFSKARKNLIESCQLYCSFLSKTHYVD